jgi:large subunit ribosomal protein L25
MKTFDVSGKLRGSLGKKDSRALRNEGNVPCVLYGGENPVHFYASAKDFTKLVYTPNVYLVNLNIEGQKAQALMQDLQFDPVTDELIHIDFMKVSNDKPVKVSIPIEIKGFAKGIKSGGKLQVEIRRLSVMALPQDLPDRIEVDVTELDLGQSIRVGNLSADKVTFLNSKSVPVVRIMMTRAARAAAQQKDEGKAGGKKKK